MSVFSLSDISLVRDANKLLDKVNWEVGQGENWALIGRNGSGKTLTLKILCGYIWPTIGQVEVFGEKFGQTDVRAIRKQIGWLTPSLQFQLQNQNYLSREVVLSGCYSSVGLYDKPTEIENKLVDEKMKLLSCEHLSARSFASLSTGEQKKILLARALVSEPRLLILDEPCTGLDFTSREEFLSVIEGLACEENAPTMILVTHNVEEIMPCFTHCMLMKDGTTIDHGKKQEVLNSDSLKKLLELPFELIASGGTKRYFLKRL